MKELSGIAMRFCAFASIVALQAAFVRQDAVAGGGVVLSEAVQAQPRMILAQAEKTDEKAAFEALVEEDEKSRAQAKRASGKAEAENDKADGHSRLVNDETLYPTAAQCGECHKQIYEEWSSSNHAYASISPMFHKFEQKFQDLTQGTVGTFCVRCHQQVGTQLGENRETPLWERSQISREGVTCITCHRVKEQYGKVNGERRVEPGKIFEPVYGSGEKSVIKDVIDKKETYTVATSDEGAWQPRFTRA